MEKQPKWHSLISFVSWVEEKQDGVRSSWWHFPFILVTYTIKEQWFILFLLKIIPIEMLKKHFIYLFLLKKHFRCVIYVSSLWNIKQIIRFQIPFGKYRFACSDFLFLFFLSFFGVVTFWISTLGDTSKDLQKKTIFSNKEPYFDRSCWIPN